MTQPQITDAPDNDAQNASAQSSAQASSARTTPAGADIGTTPGHPHEITFTTAASRHPAIGGRGAVLLLAGLLLAATVALGLIATDSLALPQPLTRVVTLLETAARIWRPDARPFVVLAISIAVTAASALWVLAHLSPRTARRHENRRGTPPTGWFYLAALTAMVVSSDTSWRCFGILGITSTGERVLMFAVVEIMLIGCGRALRHEIRHGDGEHGRRAATVRLTVWILAAVAAYMALLVSGPVDGALRVALGPGMGILALHHALGVDLRARRQHNRTFQRNRLARAAAGIADRILCWIAPAQESFDAADLRRHHAIRRAARIAARLGATHSPAR